MCVCGWVGVYVCMWVGVGGWGAEASLCQIARLHPQCKRACSSNVCDYLWCEECGVVLT